MLTLVRSPIETPYVCSSNPVTRPAVSRDNLALRAGGFFCTIASAGPDEALMPPGEGSWTHAWAKDGDGGICDHAGCRQRCCLPHLRQPLALEQRHDPAVRADDGPGVDPLRTGVALRDRQAYEGLSSPGLGREHVEV